MPQLSFSQLYSSRPWLLDPYSNSAPDRAWFVRVYLDDVVFYIVHLEPGEIIVEGNGPFGYACEGEKMAKAVLNAILALAREQGVTPPWSQP